MANLKDIVSPEAVAQVLKNKAVKGELEDRRQNERLIRRTDPARLALAAGVGAAGYGMKRLGDAAITPSDRRVVENLIGLQSKFKDTQQSGGQSTLEKLLPSRDLSNDYEHSTDVFYDYIDRASKASNVKVYGQDVVPMIHKIKDFLGSGKKQDPATMTPKQLEDARHYDAFQEGPISAYLHQVKKTVLEPGGAKGFLFNKGTAEKPDVLDVDPQHFYSGLENKLSDYLKHTKGVDLSQASKLNHGEQMSAIRGLGGYISAQDPAFGEAKEVAEQNLSSAQNWAANAYPQGAQYGLTALQDVPQALGYAGMGLGALGAGWYGLNKFKKWNKERKEHNTPKLAEDVFQDAFEKRAHEILTVIAQNK